MQWVWDGAELAQGIVALAIIAAFLTESIEKLAGRRKGRNMGKVALKNNANTLARELMEFLRVRGAYSPSLPRKKSWNDDVERMSEYSTETRNLYLRDLRPRVAEIRQELEAHGLQDEELDHSYEHGTNPLVIEQVALKLSELASRVPTPWWQFWR
jgi:hypothetical protein